jgi:predicted double-glycine peptidase
MPTPPRHVLAARLRSWARDLLARGRTRRPERLKVLLDPEQPRLLDLPDVRQQKDWSCGAACLRACALYFGVGPKSEAEFRALLGTDSDGTQPEDLERAAVGLGLEVAAGEMSLDDLRRYTDQGWPVICPVQQKGHGAGDSQGHYVCVVGVSDFSVFVQDPVDGRKRVGNALWARRWHDRAADGVEYRNWGIALGK